MSKRSDPKAFARAAGAPDPGTREPEGFADPPPQGSAPMVVEKEEYSPTPYLDANGFDPADYKWVPVLRRPRVDGWSPAKQRAFIEILADTGVVEQAASEVGMSVQSAYALRRAPGGEPFAAAWAAALHQASFKLVDLAYQRAINGSDEPVFDRNGNRVGRRLKPSDQMLMFLLRAHQPERYRHAHQSVRHPAEASLPPVTPVAEAIATLEPIQPPEPHKLTPPAELDVDIQVADMCAEMGEDLPPWHRHTRPEPEWVESPLGEEFERRLEAAKAEADAASRYGMDEEDEDWDEADAVDDDTP
jgi:hypothetical protein